MDNQKIIISKLGSLLNLPVLTVERNPIDPDWDRKVAEDRLRLTRPIFLYSIKPIVINRAEVTDSIDGGHKIVQFNDDPDLQLPLLNIKDINELIPVPSHETVKEAILASGSRKKLFTDYPKLYKYVSALNIDSKAEWDKELEMMIKFSKTFKEANELEKIACEKFLKDMGINPQGLL